MFFTIALPHHSIFSAPNVMVMFSLEAIALKGRLNASGIGK